MPLTPDVARDLASLEALMRDLSDSPGNANALMHEHLESARFYLTGAMPDEFRFSLGLAAKHLSQIEDSGLRSRIAEFLRLHQAHPDQTPEG